MMYTTNAFFSFLFLSFKFLDLYSFFLQDFLHSLRLHPFLGTSSFLQDLLFLQGFLLSRFPPFIKTSFFLRKFLHSFFENSFCAFLQDFRFSSRLPLFFITSSFLQDFFLSTRFITYFKTSSFPQDFFLS